MASKSRRSVTTWDWPTFNANPEQENLEQMSRWSLNTTPSWSSPPAIANKYMTTKPTSRRACDVDSFSTSVGPRLAERRSTQGPTSTSNGWPATSIQRNHFIRIRRRPHEPAYIRVPAIWIVQCIRSPLAQGCIGSNPVGLANLNLTLEANIHLGCFA